MSQQATFRFERDGRPLSITILATYNIRTAQVVFSVTNSTTGESLGNNLLGNQVLGVLDQFGTAFPSDAPQVEAARQFVVQTQQDILAANPQIQSPAPPVSTGTTVAQDQQANTDRADTQNPNVPAQRASATGVVTNTATSTDPSNADPSQAPVPDAVPAPGKLPAGQVDGATTDAGATVPAAFGEQGPAAARQSVGTNLDQPDENTNLVSYVYKAIEVTSQFRQGKFTQEITGAQIFFPIGSQGRPGSAAQQAQQAQQGRELADSASAARVASRAAAAASRSRPQGTVGAIAGTPGVEITGELGAFFGTGETSDNIERRVREPRPVGPLPGSSFGAEGFEDPTAQGSPPVQAPLRVDPPTTRSSFGATTSVALPSTAGRQDIERQISAARQEVRENERLLAGVEQRISRREGDPITNRELRALYVANIQREQRIITRLEAQLNDTVGPTNNQTNVAPQQGAREF